MTHDELKTFSLLWPKLFRGSVHLMFRNTNIPYHGEGFGDGLSGDTYGGGGGKRSTGNGNGDGQVGNRAFGDGEGGGWGFGPAFGDGDGGGTGDEW